MLNLIFSLIIASYFKLQSLGLIMSSPPPLPEPPSGFNRNLLVLYENQTKLPLLYVPAVRYLGFVLEYYGYIPVYRELQEQCPHFQCKQDESFAGIVIWIDSVSSENLPLIDWLKKQIKQHIPVAFLHGFGVPIDTPQLKDLGIFYVSAKPSNVNLHILKQNKTYMSQTINPSLAPYDFSPICAKGGESLLTLANQYGQTEEAVAIMPWGGYALNPYLLTFLPDARAFWVIDPFAFMASALRLKAFPIPDTTTENGRRLMSIHIDGDGFSNPARWLGSSLTAVELRDRILKRFRFPTSVSVITGEIAPNGIKPPKAPELMAIARSIFALPWVESASHTFSHPFLWQKDQNYDLSNTGEENYSLKIPHYHFNAHTEIVDSVDFINQYLVPANKQCRLLFWSGMANPTSQQVNLAYDHGLLNINGLNDTHMTTHFPSLAAVRPLGIKKGNNYQIFAPIDMDFSYINHFAGPLYGFKEVIETFNLTNSPRRLKPISLYYHMYSASYPAMLSALIQIYQWLKTQETMPIYISEYIEKALDFYHIHLNETSRGWEIFSHNHLREFRSAPHLGYPDLIHSENVVGFNTHQHMHYIHIGPGSYARIQYQATPPTVPYLVDANATLLAWNQDKGHYYYKFAGHVPVEFTLRNTTACKIKASSQLKIKTLLHRLTRYYSAKDHLEIHIYC